MYPLPALRIQYIVIESTWKGFDWTMWDLQLIMRILFVISAMGSLMTTVSQDPTVEHLTQRGPEQCTHCTRLCCCCIWPAGGAESWVILCPLFALNLGLWILLWNVLKLFFFRLSWNQCHNLRSSFRHETFKPTVASCQKEQGIQSQGFLNIWHVIMTCYYFLTFVFVLSECMSTSLLKSSVLFAFSGGGWGWAACGDTLRNTGRWPVSSYTNTHRDAV